MGSYDGDVRVRGALWDDGPVSEQQSPTPAKPGRYQRSSAGMIGAMVVSLLIIFGYVGFRSLVRDDLEVEPETVDYLSVVDQLQAAGKPVFYPPELPKGWRATSADYDVGTGSFSLGANTVDGDYAGVYQRDGDLMQLLTEQLDATPRDEGAADLDSRIAQRWQSWTDEGGDHAYTAEIDGVNVIVYGSAPADDLRTLAESLTDHKR